MTGIPSKRRTLAFCPLVMMSRMEVDLPTERGPPPPPFRSCAVNGWPSSALRSRSSAYSLSFSLSSASGFRGNQLSVTKVMRRMRSSSCSLVVL